MTIVEAARGVAGGVDTIGQASFANLVHSPNTLRVRSDRGRPVMSSQFWRLQTPSLSTSHATC
jgi:hypothetical protein